MADGHPEGKYTSVNCTPIQGHGGSLSNGTGTFTESTATFSCGDFAAKDFPTIGAFYNLNGDLAGKREDFPGWKCTHAGKTSDFKAVSKADGPSARPTRGLSGAPPTPHSRTHHNTSTTNKETGMNYSLNIAIDDAGLKQIYQSNQFVTLVKSVSASQAAENTIIWLSFQPIETNTVAWVENYFIYATTTEMQDGATITMTSQTQAPVVADWTYTFAEGMFNGASGGAQGAYTADNQMKSDGFNFGLAQQANVNNVPVLAPLNAVPVLYNESAAFTPQENLSLFLSSYQNNGTVISQVTGAVLPITLTSANPTANIGFNDGTNSFYLMSSGEQFSRRLQNARSQAFHSLRK